MLFRHTCLSLATIGVLVAWAPTTQAYDTYTASPGAYNTNCGQCHGDFKARPYFSLHDGSAWSGSLHDVHQGLMLSGDCDTCHSAARNPVILNSSNGGVGLAPIGCVGCHGRTQDRSNPSAAVGDGAGLRQHHFNSGVTSCVGCHSDAHPANKTVVAENVLPPFYFSPDSAHPNKPTDPCNVSGGENFAGSPLGLDNDGNRLYDTADPACAAFAVTATPTATATSTPLLPTPTFTNAVAPTPTRTAPIPGVPTNTPAQPTNTPGLAWTPTRKPAATSTATRPPTATSTRPSGPPTPIATPALSGAALYFGNCVSCHGDPRTTAAAPVASRKVPGARICLIRNAIAGVPSMQFLAGQLSIPQLQAIATFLNSFPVSGQQRYTTACAACHGATPNVDGSVIEAISEVGAMRFLGCLTPPDFSQISAYLGSVTGGGGDSEGGGEGNASGHNGSTPTPPSDD